MKSLTSIVGVICGVVAFTVPLAAAAQVELVSDAALDAAARHGLEKLEQVFVAKGLQVKKTVSAGGGADYLVVAGLCAAPGIAARTLREWHIVPPATPEALVIHKGTVQGTPALALCGADSRGLMYAALDAAERISWPAASLFDNVREAREQPFLRDRAVSMYTMQRAYFESRLYDENYWRRYFDLLAQNRINRFLVVFGYENGGFMAPIYPYFFDVDGFPEVRTVGLTARQQEHNTQAFHALIRIAHERGVEVSAGIWDHIYRGGVQGGGIDGASDLAGKRVPGLVWGVTSDNLAAYTKAALRKFLATFPELDSLQLRMHEESGLKRAEMEGFWHEVFSMIRQMRPDLPVEIRAKGLPDPVIDDIVAMKLPFRIGTKYWMEQMGLPYHPTHVHPENQHDRRHGYADLLRYPQRYKVQWRLWNGGTARLLLWADPDYVRRYLASARLYDGDGFEVNEMLATKMLAEPHDAPPLPILNARYRYYDYEFERYWHFYQLWGRIGYNPQTGSELWDREFGRRFGVEAGKHLEAGLHLASQVLPRIVAASYPYRFFPTTRGWAEMMRMGDLPEYAKDHSTDTAQFLSGAQAAANRIAGKASSLRSPEQTSHWFASLSEKVLAEVSKAEHAAGSSPGKEFLSTVTDLRILAGLAAYHSHRLQAGVHYSLFEQSGDWFELDDAITQETAAVQSWERMVEAAGTVYSPELPFGVHEKGFSRHWKEELGHLQHGLAELEKRRAALKLPSSGASPAISFVPVRHALPAASLTIRATIAGEGGIREARVIVTGSPARPYPMREVGPNRYLAKVPVDKNETRLRYTIEAVAGGGRTTTEPVETLITADPAPPEVTLDPVKPATTGHDVEIAARVADRSGVGSVRLRYRHLTQFEDYQVAPMALNRATGRYEARIPAAFVTPAWDLMYYVEALDTKGNGRQYPDLEVEAPYVIVPVQR